MANATFKSIDEFIDGFTKTEPYAETLYDGIIWGDGIHLLRSVLPSDEG